MQQNFGKIQKEEKYYQKIYYGINIKILSKFKHVFDGTQWLQRRIVDWKGKLWHENSFWRKRNPSPEPSLNIFSYCDFWCKFAR